MTLQKYDTAGFHLESSCPLDQAQQSALIEMVRDADWYLTAPERQAHLAGRGKLIRREVDRLGSLVAKRYVRGGLLHLVNADLFLRYGAVRSAREFAMLELARSIGVSAPLPIASIWEGARLYRAWLVMQEIKGEETLAAVSLYDEERAMGALDRFVKQLGLLVEHRILHVDLHPGNVLIDSENLVYVIDFDKSRRFKGDQRDLREYYLRRWRRAVIKHKLPAFVSERVCLALRIHSKR